MERNISWASIERIVAHWGRPFAIKGLQSVNDARLAAAAGASAVVLSNHGGRQLDGVPQTIDLEANLIEPVGDRMEVIFVGGIRRGTNSAPSRDRDARACHTG